jgi:N-acetylmuramoyl-L-alanine amidase
LSVAQQFSVLLDPGHRNTPNDCGAPSSCGGYCEADLVLDFAIFGYSEIDFNPNCDFDPFQTRQGSQSRTLQQRVDMANNTSGF